jgi:hypothetical protein
MSTIRRRAALMLCVGILFSAVFASAPAHRASAALGAPPPITLPPITLPPSLLQPLLDGLRPAFEVIGPVATPICADALLVGSVVAISFPDVANLLNPLTSPLFVVCGAVPPPKGATVTCDIDAVTGGFVSQTLASLGKSLPNVVTLGAALYGETVVLEDNLPAPAADLHLSALIAPVLGCRTGPPPETSHPVAGPVTQPLPPPSTAAVETTSASGAPAGAARPIAAGTPNAVAAPAAAAAPATVVSQVRFVGFRYPGVFALPLLLLGLVVLFGRALTVPVLDDGRPE